MPFDLSVLMPAVNFVVGLLILVLVYRLFRWIMGWSLMQWVVILGVLVALMELNPLMIPAYGANIAQHVHWWLTALMYIEIFLFGLCMVLLRRVPGTKRSKSSH